MVKPHLLIGEVVRLKYVGASVYGIVISCSDMNDCSKVLGVYWLPSKESTPDLEALKRQRFIASNYVEFCDKA